MTINDLIFCSETWQKSGSKFNIDGYKCITVPRPESMQIRGKGKRGHGGVCLFVRNSISDGIEVVHKDSSGFLWVKLRKLFFGLESDMFVCFCYIPPKDSIYFKNVDINLFDVLERDIRFYSDFGKIIVVGDLNARTGLSDDHFIGCENIDKYIHCLEGADLFDENEISVGRRFSLDTKIDSSGIKLLQICKDACLRILNGRVGDDAGIGNFTFQSAQGKSLIDYVLLSPGMFDIINGFTVHHISVFSDHAPIQFSIKSNVSSTSSEEPYEIKKLVWDTSKLGQFIHSLSGELDTLNSFVNDIVSENISVDEGVNNFANTLYNTAFQVFGQVKRLNCNNTSNRTYTSPWFNYECEVARAELKRANKQFRKYRTHTLHETLVTKRKHYSTVKKHARFIYNQTKKQKLHDLASNNPRLFWQEIRRMRGNTPNDTPLCLQDFFEHFKDIYSANSDFKQAFVEQFVERGLDGNYESSNMQHYDTSALDATITCAEVKMAICKLKRSKSPGSDLLPPELFIESTEIISDMLCKLFNFIFTNHGYPESWTKGIIVPVPKKGDLSNVNNYRGITLTSIFSKVYSHILEDRLRTWTENNNIIDDNQFGFRKNKSTVDCIFILQAIINKQLCRKRKLYCTFIDFKKAFDLVYRNGIWFKLCELGASLNFVKSVKAMYNSVKVYVKSMGRASECFDSLVGVKQGEPMSPLLFILFLNDLSNELDIDSNIGNINEDIIDLFQKFILLFADDTVLLSESLSELQILLNKLAVYCKKWNITVNTEKTKAMLFKCSNRPEVFDIFYDNVRLEAVDSFIYLGVCLSSNGSFYKAQRQLADQASKALYSLKSLFDKSSLIIEDKLKLFDALVLPIMNYASEVWGFHNSLEIEKVHLRFLKSILGVRQQTCSMAVYGELGRMPLFVLRKVRILKYWYKILSDPYTLLYKVYIKQVQDVNNHRNLKCWSANIKCLLNELGFSYLWINQEISQLQLNMVIQRVYDHFLQEFYTSVQLTSKMAIFKITTKHFQLEKYITSVNIDKHRISLSRFRCSAHKLMIEEGRFRGIDRDARICPMCSMNIVEDEYHFLLVCPVYRELRKIHLPKYYCRWPSKYKFIKLLNEDRDNVLRKFAKYVYLANEKRLLLLNSTTDSNFVT